MMPPSVHGSLRKEHPLRHITAKAKSAGQKADLGIYLNHRSLARAQGNSFQDLFVCVFLSNASSRILLRPPSPPLNSRTHCHQLVRRSLTRT